MADLTVPAGGTLNVAAGSVDLACTDLIVAGTLNIDTGSLFNVRDVVVLGGGVLNGDSGSIVLSRNFDVRAGGAFNSGSSSVRYDTACGPGVAPHAVPVPTAAPITLALQSLMLGLLTMLFLVRRQRAMPRHGEKP